MPLGREVVVTVRGGVTVSVSSPETTVRGGDEESVADTVNVEDPVEPGVPLMVPVAESRLRPVGRFPLTTDQA